MQSRRDLLASLPAVGRIMESSALRRLSRRFGTRLVTDLVREELRGVRERIGAGEMDPPEARRRTRIGSLARSVDVAARSLLAPSPRPVINATGVVVHTNLGRSLLSEEAAHRVAEAATRYMDLEYDLERGARGNRMTHLRPLLARLFPGSDALVVNNNAAAILLALRALARGKEVVISRGELVEIGGSFRVPDILAASGARLREVGTTNRTRPGDYRAALSSRTGLLLKVHTSNFRIVGFTEEVTVGSLAQLARETGVPLVVDWGSGDLVDLGPAGIHDEMPVERILGAGADLVTFSGDKLLGGPQAGFVVGAPKLVRKIARDPLARVCRLDRLMICALRETLASYVRGRAFHEVPTLVMLSIPITELERRCRRVRREVVRLTGARSRLAVEDGWSRPGGGSSPAGRLPTRLLAVRGRDGDAGRLENLLRRGDPPVVARVHEGRLLLDLRTVLPSQDEILARRLAAAMSAERSD